MHYNIGGAKRHESYLYELILSGKMDVLCLSETHTPDREFWMEMKKLLGIQLLVCSRQVTIKSNGTFKRSSGGVAIINCNPRKISITAIEKDSRGLISADVRFITGKRTPFFVMSMYVNPAGSPYITDNAPLLAIAQHAVLRAQETYGDKILIATDANARIVTKFGADQLTNTQTQMFNAFLKATDLWPLHGRSLESFADYTSRNIIPGVEGKSTVDFILAPSKWNNSIYKTMMPVHWSALESSTHRPITVSINWQTSDTAAIEAATTIKPRYAKPKYASEKWEIIATTATATLNGDSNDARLLRTPNITPEEAFKAFENIFTKVLDDVIPAQIRRGNMTGNTTNGKTERTSRREHIMAQSRSAKVRFKRNIFLPRPIVELIKNSQKAVEEGRKLGTIKAIAIGLDARNAARHALRKHRRTNNKMKRKDLALSRTNDTRAFYDAVKDSAPENPHLLLEKSTIPNEEGQIPALPRFTAAFVADFCSTPITPPGATDRSWLDLLTKVPSDGLGRDIHEDEIINVIAPHEIKRALPCFSTGNPTTEDLCCPLCVARLNRAASDRGRGDLVFAATVDGSMSVNSSAVCSGPIAMKHITWPHCTDSKSTTEYRVSVAKALAAVLMRH